MQIGMLKGDTSIMFRYRFSWQRRRLEPANLTESGSLASGLGLDGFITRYFAVNVALRHVCVALVCGFGLVACQKAKPPDDAATRTDAGGTQSKSVVKASGTPEPTEEPTESVLTDLLAKQYKQINDNGGMPVTVSATGQEHVLRPKLHDARKDSCRKLSEHIGGGYECSMSVMVTLKDDGSKPRKSGERLTVYWDSEKGEWASGQRKRGKR